MTLKILLDQFIESPRVHQYSPRTHIGTQILNDSLKTFHQLHNLNWPKYCVSQNLLISQIRRKLFQLVTVMDTNFHLVRVKGGASLAKVICHRCWGGYSNSWGGYSNSEVLKQHGPPLPLPSSPMVPPRYLKLSHLHVLLFCRVLKSTPRSGTDAMLSTTPRMQAKFQ